MTTDPRSLRISDYDYPLPDARIAQHPCTPRNAAKLLVWDRGKLSDLSVDDAPEVVSQWGPYRLVVNEARVIPARMYLPRPSGIGHFELFYLDADGLSVEQAMAQTETITAWCKVRPSKKWAHGSILVHESGLTAERLEVGDGESKVRFAWTDGRTWAEMLSAVGRIPLPPYMHRDDTPLDQDRYQSVFARHEGSVAAPTASLHWTPELMERWREVCADIQSVTLHIGAGTFQPVSADEVGDHRMHAEEVVVARSTLEALADGLPVLAMGTTAARTLESLYWWALDWQQRGIMPTRVDQWAPYQGVDAAPVFCGSSTNADSTDRLPPEVCALFQWAAESLAAAEHEVVSFRTALILAPGYEYRVVNALITNFHQPQSTLLLLIAAGLGSAWRGIYDYALEHDYRFLSYGDANLYRW